MVYLAPRAGKSWRMWSLHVLHESVWVFSGYSNFLLQWRDMHVRLTSNSNFFPRRECVWWFVSTWSCGWILNESGKLLSFVLLLYRAIHTEAFGFDCPSCHTGHRSYYCCCCCCVLLERYDVFQLFDCVMICFVLPLQFDESSRPYVFVIAKRAHGSFKVKQNIPSLICFYVVTF